MRTLLFYVIFSAIALSTIPTYANVNVSLCNQTIPHKFCYQDNTSTGELDSFFINRQGTWSYSVKGEEFIGADTGSFQPIGPQCAKDKHAFYITKFLGPQRYVHAYIDMASLQALDLDCNFFTDKKYIYISMYNGGSTSTGSNYGLIPLLGVQPSESYILTGKYEQDTLCTAQNCYRYSNNQNIIDITPIFHPKSLRQKICSLFM